MTAKLRAFAAKHRTIILAMLACAVLIGAYFLSEPSSGPRTPDRLPELSELSEMRTASFQNYADYFRRIAEDKGAVYAFDLLRYAPLAEGVDVHLLAHTIGDILYEQEGMQGIYECTQEFRNACSHSVVIGILNEHGEGALDDIAATCRKAPGGAGAYTMCFHGLGHGVLAFNGYKLEKAVAMCEKTGTDAYRRREYVECMGGASMEMMAGVHDRAVWEKESVNYFKESDPLYPCNAPFMPAEVQPICFVHLTPHLFEAAGMDLGRPDDAFFAEAFSYCDALPKDDLANRSACYGGFGKEFIGITQSKDIRAVGDIEEPALRQMRAWCTLANDEFGEHECNANALASLFWGGENKIDASLGYCAIAEGEEAGECYRQLAEQIRYYLPEGSERAMRCDRLPEAYQSRCAAS